MCVCVCVCVCVYVCVCVCVCVSLCILHYVLLLNLVYIVYQIYKLSLKSERCSDIHRIFPIECLCAFAPGEEGDKLR